VNATNMLERIKERAMRFRVWVVCRLWAKLVAGVPLLIILGVILVSIGAQTGIPTWLTFIGLVVVYLVYGGLTMFLHWTYSMPLSLIRSGDADCQGVPYSLEYDLQQQALVRQVGQQCDAQQLELLRQMYEQDKLVVGMVLPKGCSGYPIFVGNQKIYAVGSPEFNGQIVAAIHQINQQLAPTGRQVPERVAIDIIAMTQQFVRPGASEVEQTTDDEQGEQNGGQQ
jgi:hypothetical protein